MVTFFNPLSFNMSWAGRDERYEWNNCAPSNQRNNKECSIIHSSFIGDCRQSFKSPAAQFSSVALFMLELMSEDSSRCTLWWKLSSSCGCYECFPISYMFLGPHMKLLIHSPVLQPRFTWATSTRQAGGSHVHRIGLSVPLPILLANALLYLGHFILQVHFHWHLHFWVIDKNIGERILHDRIHLPSRSVELAGFQCHCYGVSSTPLYFSRQRYAIELFKKMSGCSLFFSLELYWKWENAEVC